MSEINQVIRKRRSVYPVQFIEGEISKQTIEALLLNANHAPTHRLTEPWRFKVFMENGKANLGDFLANKYKEITPEFSASKFEKIRQNPRTAGAVLAIVLHRDPAERVPEWEETASVAMAVQNIWISLEQYGLGGYWSSPPLAKYLGEHIEMKENESCIGFFYLGLCNPSDRIVQKKPIEEKVSWITE